jgi:hypothetical protein
MYVKLGIKLKTLMMDGELHKDGLNGEMAGIGVNFNAVAREEHALKLSASFAQSRTNNMGIYMQLLNLSQ